MKNFFAYAASLGLVLSVNIALPAPASAHHTTVKFCKLVLDDWDGNLPSEYGPAFHFDNLGECASFLYTRTNVQYCKGAQALGALEYLGFKNFGDCVASG